MLKRFGAQQKLSPPNCNIDAEPASLVYLQIQVLLEESHKKLYSEILLEALLLLISKFLQVKPA